MPFYDLKGELGESALSQCEMKFKTQYYSYGLWVRGNSPNSLLRRKMGELLTPRRDSSNQIQFRVDGTFVCLRRGHDLKRVI